VRFTGEGAVEKGVAERPFELAVEARTVPGLLWTPADAAGVRPLVLLGHGGTNHKRSPYILSAARLFVRHHGFAAAALDAPGHGERATPGWDRSRMTLEEFRQSLYADRTFDETIEEWKAALDAVQNLDGVGAGPVGYWGLSMGTALGIPFIAAEPRVRVAVLGLMGAMAGRVLRDAPAVRCPLLFLQQLEDELMSRESVLALFDALGAEDKRLHANPGKHVEVPRGEHRASVDFLADRLAAHQ
jgi:dienelactone hydrolase